MASYKEEMEEAQELVELLVARIESNDEERDSGKLHRASKRMKFLELDSKYAGRQLAKAREAVSKLRTSLEYESTLLEREQKNRSGAR
jgi:hypothetical protein